MAGRQQSRVQGHVLQVEDELLDAEGESQSQDEVHPKEKEGRKERRQFKTEHDKK